MLPPLPRCSRRAQTSLKLTQSVSAFPGMGAGSACTSSFSRIAQRSLTLRPAHSHGHLRDRHPGASDTSSPPCLPRLLPAGAISRVGLAPTGKAPPSHGAPHSRTFSAAFPRLETGRRVMCYQLAASGPELTGGFQFKISVPAVLSVAAPEISNMLCHAFRVGESAVNTALACGEKKGVPGPRCRAPTIMGWPTAVFFPRGADPTWAAKQPEAGRGELPPRLLAVSDRSVVSG